MRAAYEQKEAEYPVMAGIYRYTIGQGPQARLDREALVAWARERFGARARRGRPEEQAAR